MSDRTWNQIESRIYEEDWTKGARLVAGVLLARCPNQYGVFRFPLGYLKDFFKDWFTPIELEGFFREWESDGWVKFYNGFRTIWIVNKWKRFGKPSDNHWKGLITHLEEFPEVREDFLACYQPPSIPLQRGSELPRNPESESESDTEKKSKKISKSTQDSDKSDFPPELSTIVNELFPPEIFKWKPEERLKHVKALDDLTRLDGYPQTEVFAVLRWMRSDVTERGDWHGWSSVFNSIPALRANGCKKYLNARSQWQRNGSGQPAMALSPDGQYDLQELKKSGFLR